jgi:hypothetical protein
MDWVVQIEGAECSVDVVQCLLELDVDPLQCVESEFTGIKNLRLAIGRKVIRETNAGMRSAVTAQDGVSKHLMEARKTLGAQA